MPMHPIPIAVLSLLLMPVSTAIGQVPAEPEADLRAVAARLMRENERLRLALQSCAAKAAATPAEAPAAAAADTPKPPAHLALAADARFAAADTVAGAREPAPATGALRDSPPPDKNVQYVAGDEKADQAVSPIPFPQVPQRTDWFLQHLAQQYSVLRRLYTQNALAGLTQDEAQCSDARTRLYCQMAVRLYWIDSAR